MSITGVLYNSGHSLDEYVEWEFSPDRGWGPFAQYRVDMREIDLCGLPPGLVYVDVDLAWLAKWYMRRWSAWPLVWLCVRLRTEAYFPFLRWLWRRGLIVKPVNEVFSWRRHFRPLGVLRKRPAC